MGGLHGDFVLSPLRSVGVTFLKMRPKNGRVTRGPLFFLRSATCSFFGWRSFSVALFVFFKFAFGAVYTGTPVFSLLHHLFFLGRGVRFFSALNAVLFCAFVVWRVGRAFCYVFCCVWAFGAPVWVCRQLAL